MDPNPLRVDGLHQGVSLSVWHDNGCMPPRASVQHVEDDVCVDKKQIKLHLGVERVWKISAACIAGARLGPLSANTTGLDYFWDQVQYFL